MIAGCARCTNSSKRKGPGGSSEMREGHPLRLHPQALPIILFSNRMLKKSASFVLALLRGSTLRKSFSEVGSTRGDFPFAKIYSQGERSTRSVVCTSSPLRSLRPCWTNFLSILCGVLLLSQMCRPVKPKRAHRVFRSLLVLDLRRLVMKRGDLRTNESGKVLIP